MDLKAVQIILCLQYSPILLHAIGYYLLKFGITILRHNLEQGHCTSVTIATG